MITAEIKEARQRLVKYISNVITKITSKTGLKVASIR